MTRWKAVLAGLLALALVSTAPPLIQPATAQVLDSRVLRATPLNAVNTAISTDVAFLVKYIGTSAVAKIAVDATTGDITFTDGAAGTEATDTFECPVSAGLGGVIDVSDTACNTFGEISDVVNASSDWRLVLLDVMRSDDADVSSGALITLAATAAQAENGLGVLLDNTTTFLATRAMVPPEARRFPFYCESANCSVLRSNPFAYWRPFLQDFNATSTYASGTSALNIYSVVGQYGANGSEVEALEYSTAGGATTANAAISAFRTTPLLLPQGSKPIFRVTNSAAMSAITSVAAGFATDARY